MTYLQVQETVDAVLLLSGGIESSTLLHLRRSERLAPLFLDYGQRAARLEEKAARTQCALAGLTLAAIDGSDLGRALNAVRPVRFHVPLPQRNLMALAVGVNWAAAHGARRLYLGVNAEDPQSDPSAATPFLAPFGSLMETLSGVRIETPFLACTKTDILRQGLENGVDYALTYSCLRGHRRHCGQCPQCHRRRQAAQAVPMSEPEDFYEHD